LNVQPESTRHPNLLTQYRLYLDHQDSSSFISVIASHYHQGTLQRLAEDNRAEVRRGAVLALGYVGDYDVNHTLGRALHDDDRTVRMLSENGIKNIWTRAGDDCQRQRLEAIIRLISAHQFDEAIRNATELIDTVDWFAEVWHQRAIAHLRQGNYVESIRDSHQSLELNPYHFPAATGMGQAYLQLNNQVSALECFRRALRLNPNLEGVRVQIERLSRMIEGK
jgi:tetratricopeptide (TPR) repeat protein